MLIFNKFKYQVLNMRSRVLNTSKLSNPKSAEKYC